MIRKLSLVEDKSYWFVSNSKLAVIIWYSQTVKRSRKLDIKCNMSQKKFCPCHLCDHSCCHSSMLAQIFWGFSTKTFLIANINFCIHFHVLITTRCSRVHFWLVSWRSSLWKILLLITKTWTTPDQNFEIWHASTDNKKLILKQIINWKNINRFIDFMLFTNWFQIRQNPLPSVVSWYNK